nr:reverse transcriptase domain-containing protein [Tanacetum cinerariifolium]
MLDYEDSTITYTVVSSPFGEFVPEPVYPEFMPAKDDILTAEEQPVPAAALPTTESNPEDDPEDDPEEDPEEDHEDDPDVDPEDDHEDDPEKNLADYPTDGGDEGDDEDESSNDDEDDDIDIEGDEEDDEYLAPADSTYVALPTVDHAPSAEETKPFETDDSAATPPPHPTYRIPSLPLPILSPPPTDPTYEEAPLGYRAARLRWRAKREEIPEADLLLQKRLCIAHTCTYELGESFVVAAARLRELVRDDLYRSHPGDCTDHRGGGQSKGSKPQISNYSRDTTEGDQGVAGSRPQATSTVHTGTEYTEVMSDLADCNSRTHSDLKGRQSPSTARGIILYKLRSCIFFQFIYGMDKMTPKRTTRANPATTTTTTTTSVTDAQLEALIEQYVAKTLLARDVDRNTNGDDNHVSRTDMKKKMTDKYCPRGEMKKLESELWNLRVKSNDVVSYSHRFQELALLCVRMFFEESDKIKRYVGGLPDVIHGSVVASRPKTMQKAIEMENELMDKRNNTWAECQAKNKRKFNDTSRNNQSQQQQ